MTLIVGIYCENGVVVAADGAATTATPLGQATIRQQSRKLKIINGSLIVGVSGPVGLSQRFEAEIEEKWKGKAFSNLQPHEAMQLLRETLWKYVQPEMEAARTAIGVIGQSAAAASALSQTLVAMPVSKELCLFQFDHQCAPERATPELPFVAIGLGQTTADPFLAFLRAILWPGQSPSIALGILTACWSLLHAIRTMSGGVAEPIQVAVLEKTSAGKYSARELLDEELGEPRQFIEEAQAQLGETLRNQLKPSSKAKPPKTEGIPEPDR